MKAPDPDIKKHAASCVVAVGYRSLSLAAAHSSEVCFVCSNNNQLLIWGLKLFKGALAPLWKTLGMISSSCDAHPRYF